MAPALQNLAINRCFTVFGIFFTSTQKSTKTRQGSIHVYNSPSIHWYLRPIAIAITLVGQTHVDSCDEFIQEAHGKLKPVWTMHVHDTATHCSIGNDVYSVDFSTGSVCVFSFQGERLFEHRPHWKLFDVVSSEDGFCFLRASRSSPIVRYEKLTPVNGRTDWRWDVPDLRLPEDPVEILECHGVIWVRMGRGIAVYRHGKMAYRRHSAELCDITGVRNDEVAVIDVDGIITFYAYDLMANSITEQKSFSSAGDKIRLIHYDEHSDEVCVFDTNGNISKIDNRSGQRKAIRSLNLKNEVTCCFERQQFKEFVVGTFDGRLLLVPWDELSIVMFGEIRGVHLNSVSRNKDHIVCSDGGGNVYLFTVSAVDKKE